MVELRHRVKKKMVCLKVCVYGVATPQGSLSHVILSGNKIKSLRLNFYPKGEEGSFNLWRKITEVRSQT